MSTTLTPTSIQQATQTLIAAKTKYTEVTSRLMARKGLLESLRAKLVVAGVNGKNAEEREANLRVALQQDIEVLERYEQSVLIARHEMEVAQLELDSIRYQLRLLEALKGVEA